SLRALSCSVSRSGARRDLPSFPTRRSSDLCGNERLETMLSLGYMPPVNQMVKIGTVPQQQPWFPTTVLYCGECELVQLGLAVDRSEEHTSELQSRENLVCRLLLEKKNTKML